LVMVEILQHIVHHEESIVEKKRKNDKYFC